MKRLEPTLRITDARRPWIPAVMTDVRVTFRVERARLKAAAERLEREREAGTSHHTIIAIRREGKT